MSFESSALKATLPSKPEIGATSTADLDASKEAVKLPLFHLYIDDSGTRHPDRCKPTSTKGDWFALGGILLKAEDEPLARKLYRDFCQKWEITYPLHSVKIRHRAGKFSWLASAPQSRVDEFFGDLTTLLCSVPVFGHGCVIDRPGYHARYYEKYGRQRWHLCKTAFTVLCERTAKYAREQERRIKVFIEETDPSADRAIRSYFEEMRSNGMPFAKDTSAKYGPLTAEELRYRLLDLRFKRKSSPMAQLADLYLYPICRSSYDRSYRPMTLLRQKGRLVEALLSADAVAQMGIKYSCFDDSKKGPRKDPPPASSSETS